MARRYYRRSYRRHGKSPANEEMMDFFRFLGVMFVIFIWYQICLVLSFMFPPVGIPLTAVTVALTIIKIKRKRTRAKEQEKDRVERIIKSGIADIDRMDGQQFERYLFHLFKRSGLKVELTSTTGDFGADLLVTLKDGRRIAIQAKRYKKHVGIEAVQEVFSAVSYYRASAGVVITNNGFTTAAAQLAEKNGVILLDRKHLIALSLGEQPLESHFV